MGICSMNITNGRANINETKLTYSDFETFNEVFMLRGKFILVLKTIHMARNKKSFKMKKSDAKKFKRAIDLFKFHKSCKFIEENDEKI